MGSHRRPTPPTDTSNGPVPVIIDAQLKQLKIAFEDAVEAAMGRRSDSYGFVAPPLDLDKWKAYAAAECAVAAGQGASTASEDGIVIAVRADGTVARRGLGKPVWKMVAAELSPPEQGEA